MESQLQPLRLFMKRYDLALSPLFLNRYRCLPTPGIFGAIVQGVSWAVSLLPSSAPPKPRPFLETAYGLEVNADQTDENTAVLSLSAEQCLSSERKIRSTTDEAIAPYQYAIFVQHGSTYLWYNPVVKNIPGEGPVSIYTINDRYPELSEYYWAWRDIVEERYDLKEWALRDDAPIFPNVEDKVAWETAGFLMACYLAAQDNVGSVYYMPFGGEYIINKGNINQVAREFLNDKNDLLEFKIVDKTDLD
ncbi:hypothetical protein FQN54_008962 [Arachnomyces sp. PD_36]|nr:hypothetical protein FQN54_008962 [Arachnomyces sp. PD_36]